MTRTNATLIAGPALLRRSLARLEMAGGRWLVAARLDPMPFNDYPLLGAEGIVCGIYLITDERARVQWLGQACRENDLVARLAEHRRIPARRDAFVTLRILHIQDRTPRAALDAIEGKCADILELRGRMGPRQWPSSENWLYTVA